MSKIIISIAVIGVLFGGFALLSNPNKSSSSSGAPGQTFSVIQQDIAGGAVLYDVRTPEEYKMGHFENAQLLPLQDIQNGMLPNKPKATTVYVYCSSGNRSRQATALLKSAGFTNVIDLHGLESLRSIGGTLTAD